MNNRKHSYTKKEDDLIMEGLASNPPSDLGATDVWAKDPDFLRFLGQIVLEDPKLKAAVVHRDDVQRWVKDMEEKRAMRLQHDTRSF